jgi:cytochrome c553
MKAWAIIALFGSLTIPALASDLPEWAYPANGSASPRDAATPLSLPGSAKTYTQAQIDDGFNPPDWYPEDHRPMPDVVAHGRKEANVRACAMCHLTNGGGRPESASIAGLPAAYMLRQMTEFKRGARNGGRAAPMVAVAKGLSDDDMKTAAAYFSRMKLPAWYKVVETDAVPKSYVGAGAMRLPVEDGGTEPLGERIIELPQNAANVGSRDPRTGYVAYVPAGSIKKGAEIVNTGSGKTTPCMVCHGPDLGGLLDIPPISGRSPIYVFRQLSDIKAGTRNGSKISPMKGIVENLDQNDMIDIAAYLVAKGR